MIVLYSYGRSECPEILHSVRFQEEFKDFFFNHVWMNLKELHFAGSSLALNR